MSRSSTRAGVIALALLAVLTASIAVVIAVNSGGGPAQGTAPPSGRTMAVSGVGTVQAIPDTLVANLGVDSHRQGSVETALNAIATDERKVHSALKAKGVASKNIQTTDLQLNPSYDNHGLINGYEATESISVRIQPLTNANVGSILSAAATAAGNSVTINGITLDVSNQNKYLDSARQAAFDEAKAAAQRDASLAGEHLGQVVSIKEVQEQSAPPMPYADSTFAAPGALAQKAIAISRGRQPVTVTLNVVWSLG